MKRSELAGELVDRGGERGRVGHVGGAHRGAAAVAFAARRAASRAPPASSPIAAMAAPSAAARRAISRPMPLSRAGDQHDPTCESRHVHAASIAAAFRARSGSAPGSPHAIDARGSAIISRCTCRWRSGSCSPPTVIAAATVQGVVGFGSNLLAVPVVALIVPSALPGAMVIPGRARWRSRWPWPSATTSTGAAAASSCSAGCPAPLIGVAVVAAVSSDVLAVVIGVVVLLGVALSVVGRAPASGRHARARRRRPASSTGVTGTAAAIDGPPLALLYQLDPPPVFRATLATQFALGSAITLAALAARRPPPRMADPARPLADAELLRRPRPQPRDPARGSRTATSDRRCSRSPRSPASPRSSARSRDAVGRPAASACQAERRARRRDARRCPN